MSGSALINRHDAMQRPDRVCQLIGIILQDPSLDDRLTGRETLRFHAKLHDVPRGVAQSRADELLALVDLTDKADEFVRSRSGGIKRRLEIALGQLHNPRVLFLDEPTIGLDLQSHRHLSSTS
jgi:ABC-2 type transport system ATP-binding protein